MRRVHRARRRHRAVVTRERRGAPAPDIRRRDARHSSRSQPRRKLVNLRARPQLTAVARSGWEWAAVEGNAELIGPDDRAAGIDDEGVRLLLRAIFTAAGGTHDDWDAFDRVMADERRTAVLVAPRRIYSNG